MPYFEFVQGDRYGDVYAALNLREALDRLTGPTHRAYRLLQLDPARRALATRRPRIAGRLQNHPDRNPARQGGRGADGGGDRCVFYYSERERDGRMAARAEGGGGSGRA